MSASKPCVVCGAECAGKPRVKDPDGRYYCKACYDARAAQMSERAQQAERSHGAELAQVAERPASAAVGAGGAVAGSGAADRPAPSRGTGSSSGPPPRPGAANAPGRSELEELAALVAGAEVSSTDGRCPGCDSPLPMGTVLCVGCGYDVRSGTAHRLATPRARPASAERSGAPAGRATAGGGRGWPDLVLDPGAWMAWMIGRGGSALVGGLATLVIALLVVLGDLPRTLRAWSEGAQSMGPGLGPFGETWSMAAPWLALGSFLGAVVLWLIGPAWFRLRVRWAGGTCTYGQARAAYFASCLPLAVVGGLHFLGVLLSFHGPSDQAFLASWYVRVGAPAIVILLSVVACIQLWHMAWRGTGAKPIESAVLLIGLPCLLYLVSLIALAIPSIALGTSANRDGAGMQAGDVDRELAPWRDRGAGRAGATSPGDAADARSADRRQGRGRSSSAPRPAASLTERPSDPRTPVRFSYPDDWTLEQEEADAYTGWPLMLTGPDGRAVLRIQPLTAAERAGDPRFIVDSFIRSVAGQTRDLGTASEGPELAYFGGRPAIGREMPFVARAGGWRGSLIAMLVRESDAMNAKAALIFAVLPSASDGGGADREAVERIITSLTFE